MAMSFMDRVNALATRERLPKPFVLGPRDPLTEEEIAALRAYRAKHGRRWKSVLLHVWSGGAPYDDTGTLRNLRNTHGPSWLVALKLPKD